MVNAVHVNLSTGGWSSAAATLFRDNFVTLFGGIQTFWPGDIGPHEFRFYNLPAAPGNVGDPAFILTASTVGSSGSAATLPPQVALTVTFQTAARRHWGRIYLGGMVTTGLLNDGRADPAAVNQIGGAFKTFLDNLNTNGMPIVVFNRKTWLPATIVGLSVDDVFDVQRRRRYDSPVNRYQTAIP